MILIEKMIEDEKYDSEELLKFVEASKESSINLVLSHFDFDGQTRQNAGEITFPIHHFSFD